MQWLISLETENDPIPACRLLNVFRRKGLKITTFDLTAKGSGFSLMAVVDTPESDVDHIFNFLRCMEGIRHVTYYRHRPSADTNYIFIDSSSDSSVIARFTRAFPESRMVFASNGKYLFEVICKEGSHKFGTTFGETELLPFSRVKASHKEIPTRLVGVVAQ